MRHYEKATRPRPPGNKPDWYHPEPVQIVKKGRRIVRPSTGETVGKVSG